jgi:hypothetical protein
MDTFSGSCLCGAVQFEYDGPSLWCAHCHCTLCQRAHGAPVVTWVGVAQERFRLADGGTLTWYRSSADSQRGFCSRCGSTLLFKSDRWPGQVHVVRSNIAGDIDVNPTGHAYWESHPAWFEFRDSLPRE